MSAKSVKNGDFYGRIGGVALLTAESDANGNYTLKTEDFKDGTIYDGLNFRFNFSYYLDDKEGVKGNGHVDVLGLSLDTIKKWTYVGLAETARSRLQYIRVYAGYQSDGKLADCELFTVQVVMAVPTSPPDMWLRCKAWKGIAGVSNKLLSSQGTFLSSAFVPGKGKGTKKLFENDQTYRSSNGLTIKHICSELANIVAEKEYGYKANNADDRSKEAKKDANSADENDYLAWYISEDLEKRLPKLRSFDFSSMTPAEALAKINSWGIVRAEWKNQEETYLDGPSYTKSLGVGLVTGGAAAGATAVGMAVGTAAGLAAGSAAYGSGVVSGSTAAATAAVETGALAGTTTGVGAGLMGVAATTADSIVASVTRQKKRYYPQLVVKPNFKDWKYDTSIQAPYVVDQDSGMVGLPRPLEMEGGEPGIMVKCLMRRDIGIGDLIEVKSAYIELPYKYYQVNMITFDGEFRGQNWYVTYRAMAVRDEEEGRKKKEALQRAKEEEQLKAKESAREKRQRERSMAKARAGAADAKAFDNASSGGWGLETARCLLLKNMLTYPK